MDSAGYSVALALLRAQRGETERRLPGLTGTFTDMVRASAGTYGTCERCGRPIPPERLEVRPVARTCVGCASRRR